MDLFTVSAAKHEDFLRHSDPALKVDDDGLTSVYLGIGAYVAIAEETDEAAASTIIVLERGYCD